jgi:hypothetical protein
MNKPSKNIGKKSTTVKLSNERYDEFKILGIRNHLSLQDFCEACVELYINSSSFQQMVNDVCKPPLSYTGSFKL